MTSNVGANVIQNKSGSLGFKTIETNVENKEYEEMKSRVKTKLKETFRPEFLNRLDEIIVFHALGEEHIKEIVDLMLEELENRLKERNIKIEMSQAAKEMLVREGYDREFGARPLRRTIRRLVENPLAEKFLSKEFDDGDTIKIDFEDDSLKFTK